ncbi:MAG: hypothetical protein A3C43_02495 [Candidatus Schekmanbacteria bacterium RIFCSPHIGHO2_02_FULL_38_11]|uniref:Uncharacterized protein n=1 Tax=Candidatus Schekmanbacteria bacterium RIFCSPLOWO2_12_FULL_38_15 TaxID=1817883 RepID=A0A1F7SPD8_9BACT|nr:MAG: hypothetical protein A3C43_02495 [Candidatus Schekmanbacteria bacterium RIFCSPHIGHO2_02_FULL_38_11]OGL51088.1 MAG: hypothetical protein A3H37_08660 [Candidatus Schekmanbacteria bacterium RIFCSPLOWO2_02_FULL_38_14]OGL55088.1 MAG: hypothetical protein A3G31_02485 [Candidatus Schekmanbacteria bacterium RIFCSPLOWO2_12_FULL_38_15]
MIKNIFIASLIGSLIGLDRTAVFQTMVSQPIVTAPVIGFLFGNYTAGIAIGIALQLIWLFSLQIGAAIVLNSTLASVIVTSSTIEMMNTISGENKMFTAIAVFSFLLCLPFLFIEQKMDMLVRKVNVFWSKKAEELINEEKFSAIGYANLSGIFFFFLKNFLFLLVSTIIITGIITMSYPVLPSSFFEGLNLFFILMPLLGIAVVLESILMKKNYIYFFIGLFIAILLKIVLENM